MKLKRVFLLAGLVALCGASGIAAEFNPVRAAPGVTETSVQHLLVRLRNAGNDTPALARRARLRLLQSRALIAGLHAMQVESETSGDSVETTLARLRADPAVQFAEVDQRRYPHAVPNDPLFAGQWYMQGPATAAAAVDAVGAWNTTTGSAGLVIAELDTGVRFDHPDLLPGGSGGRLLPGYDFVSDPAIANDGDGRDADATDPGDWVTSADTSTSRFSGCTIGGSSWHGTRVAGMLGALSNNGAGIAGLNWAGWILPVRVLGKCGGSDSDILSAMLWAAGVHVAGVPDNPYPAQIINMSLGSASGNCTSYDLVIGQLKALGVLVVVSAGNDGGPVDLPAKCAGIAGIAGLRHIGTKVGFSSLGPAIALSAPAGNCVNTLSGQPCLFSLDTTSNNGATAAGTNTYTDQQNSNLGTSFSAPIVAGIAGLMKSVNGNLGSAQLIARLREGASPFPATSTTLPAPPACHVPVNASDLQTSECICTTQTCGAGMASASGAVAAALRPIAAVALPAAVSPGQNVVLQAGGSAAACGHSITAYDWSIVAAGGAAPGISGANTADATVIAPATGSVTVRVTVTDDAGRTDSADTVLTAGAATTSAPANAGATPCLGAITLDGTGSISVGVSPSAASVLVHAGTQQFNATVFNTGILPVTWQVNGITGGDASVGTVSPAGLYTAPASIPSPATVMVTAVPSALPSAAASAQVLITSTFPVTLSPASITLITGGGTQAFAATVAGIASNAVTWQVNGITGGNASVGTISVAGVYTPPAAPPAPATVTVSAVAQADAGSSASAQVTLVAPAVTVTASTGSSSSGGGGGGGGGALDGSGLLMALSLYLLQATRRARYRACRSSSMPVAPTRFQRSCASIRSSVSPQVSRAMNR